MTVLVPVGLSGLSQLPCPDSDFSTFRCDAVHLDVRGKAINNLGACFVATNTWTLFGLQLQT
jgi:hypothetical protein